MQPNDSHGGNVSAIPGSSARPLTPPPAYHEQDGDGHMVHDESNWLVSYADMMTLLFGFFVLMYSLSKVDLDKFELVSKEVAKYFGATKIDRSIGFKMKDELQEVLTRAGVGNGAEITSTDSGIMLKFNGAILFESGSARLRAEMQPTLTEIAQAIQANRAVDGIKVEGHTDDDPIESEIFPTNWELSAARASRIARHFEAYGFPSEQLVAEGYGSSRPLLPNRRADGTAIEENQAQNRRVVINVSFGTEVLAATKALDSKKFTSPSPDAPRELDENGNPTGLAGGTAEVEPVSIEQRLEVAKARLGSVQKQLKEMESQAQKKARLAEMERKIQEMNRKTAETEKRLEQLNQGDSAPMGPADSKTVLSREEALKRLKAGGKPANEPTPKGKLEQRSKRLPAKAPAQ